MSGRNLVTPGLGVHDGAAVDTKSACLFNDADASKGREGAIGKATDGHARKIVSFSWASVMVMWLSFPVLGLREPTNPLSSTILRHQELVGLHQPLAMILFLVSTTAFVLTSVALAGHLTWSAPRGLLILPIILHADVYAIWTGIHLGLTTLQTLLLVLPLWTVLVLTALTALKSSCERARRRRATHPGTEERAEACDLGPVKEWSLA